MPITVSQALMGLAGGVVSALLFAAILGGGALGAPLLLLSPLPIVIVSLGWGSLSGVIAAVAAAAIVGGMTAPQLGFGFLLLSAGPAAWYGHLLGLARPREDGGALEWYPLSRVLASMVAITAATLVIAGWLIGLDVDEMSASIVDTIRAMAPGETDPLPERELMIETTRVYVRIMPVTTAMLWLSVMGFNIWLAAKVVKVSGRLQRPWEDIANAVALPASFVPVFAAAALAAFSDSPLGLAAGSVTGAIGMGFALQGLAVVHVLTRPMAIRPMLLGLLYAFTFAFSLPLLVLALAGMIDAVKDFRQGSRPRAAGG
ncbi:DUF2232 domain-containing protein [Chthonobacter rhizosphaerae]|uniref:DUF2232 domain-containing protein n=1 Tax=Chthonobacter rhizosphaerae TaxID=2735553 RepID=UPI0015EE4E02|nr:DUF2232 domain-containing protein [Chthonobacter rhizosphaerae]